MSRASSANGNWEIHRWVVDEGWVRISMLSSLQEDDIGFYMTSHLLEGWGMVQVGDGLLILSAPEIQPPHDTTLHRFTRSK